MKKTLDELLLEHRDRVVGTVVSAVRDGLPEQHLVDQVTDESVEPGVRASLALLPPKRIVEKLLKVAREDERPILQEERTLRYVERAQHLLNEWKKAQKAAAKPES